MNKELFKDIPNYEGIYQVSNLGNVKSLKRQAKIIKGVKRIISERILKKSVSSTNYLTVCLYKDGICKSNQIHQLVALVFLNYKNSSRKIVVDHINNNPEDNRLENLQILTQRENCAKDKKGYSSKYIGVYKNVKTNKWISQIITNGKNKYLGSFKNEYDAHLAYQKELKLIKL